MLPRLTYANIVSTIALFVALGTGGAYASTMLTGSNIKDGSLTGRDIASGSVQSSDIANGSISGSDIRDGSISAEKLSSEYIRDVSNSVSSNNIFDGTIRSADIANGAIVGADIAPGSVSWGTLDGATRNKIDDIDAAARSARYGGAGDGSIVDGSIDVCDLAPQVRQLLGYTAPASDYGCAR